MAKVRITPTHQHQLAGVAENLEPTDTPGFSRVTYSMTCTCGEAFTGLSLLMADMEFRHHQHVGAERYITEVLLEGWNDPILFIPAVTSTNNDGFVDRIYLDTENNRTMKVLITPEFVVHNYTMEGPE